MSRKLSIAVACLVPLSSFAFSGCATIVSGTTQPLTFQSTPSGAAVFVEGTQVGLTPISLNVKKSNTMTVVLKKEGYRDQTVTPKTKTTGAFWGNVICGGFFGSTTDSATGAMYEYAPDQYFVTLDAGANVPPEVKKQDEVDSDQKRIILTNYAAITHDLVRGKGEYIDGLLSQLGVHSSRRYSATNQLKKLFSDTSDASSFAAAVMLEFSDKRWKTILPYQGPGAR